MIDVFIKNLNMSFIASYVVIVVVLIRKLLKKVPKIYSYMLWGIVFFRMICPFSFESVVSWIPIGNNPISQNISYSKAPEIYSGIGSVDSTVNNLIHKTLPAVNETASINPIQIVLYIASIIWIIVFIMIVLYAVVSYVRLYKRVKTATIIENNIYETDRIRTPFVLGFIKPSIYLPLGIKDKSYEYIISHEKMHIKRKDYIIKPLYFIAVASHWFNPLMWLSYYLMTKDMEMSCDEKVMNLKGNDIKVDYAKLLLNLSVKQSSLLSPIAFGENNTKSRIKNVIKYKKPSFWIVLIAVILLSISYIGLSANPKDTEPDLSFLNIKNIAKISIQTEELVAEYEGGQSCYISGREFADLIYDTLDDWKEKKVNSALELSYTLSVYLYCDSDLAEIRFYDTEPFAMIIYDGDYRYYNIPKNFYDKLYKMYAITNYAIPKELMNILTSGKKTNKQSVNETPVNIEAYYSFTIAQNRYYIYEKNSKYYCESPYQFINEISEAVYYVGVEILKEQHIPSIEVIEVEDEIVKLIEDNLEEIMSSPKTSSNSRDYIKANNEAYENIIKYGGEDGLNFMIKQFEKGNANGLRGEIMMILCKELLGVRNNVDDDTLSAEEWFKKLKTRERVDLPDFEYQGDDPIEELVYKTEIEMNKSKRADFTIVASHIFGSYEEENKLKIFVTTVSNRYTLYGEFLSDMGGSVVPSAITYVKNEDGSYSLEKYEMSMDGAYWMSSIKEFCILPVSGKKIEGLADKIINHYSDYKDIIESERKNLIEHLKRHNQYGVSIQREYYSKPDEIIPIT